MGVGHLGFEPEFSHYAALYQFCELDNGSIGFLMSQNMCKDSPFTTLCQGFTKIREITDLGFLCGGHLGFCRASGEKFSLAL